jgi:hypothetical protein
VLGRVGREPSLCLPELARAGTGAAGDPRVVPRDGDVHEPLEEVALAGLRRPPRVLERLVRLEEAPRVDQREAELVAAGRLGRARLRRRP